MARSFPPQLQDFVCKKGSNSHWQLARAKGPHSELQGPLGNHKFLGCWLLALCHGWSLAPESLDVLENSLLTCLPTFADRIGVGS